MSAIIRSSPKFARRPVLVLWSVLSLLSLSFGLGAVPSFAEGSVDWPTISLVKQFSGLSSPVHITHAGDGSGRLFIVEQGGLIRLVKNGALQSTPFLDISGRVSSGGERGLLSVAFPPGYATKHHFYVYYTNSDGNIVVARYGLTANPDVADANSEEVILTINHPDHANHNGGQLAFGPNDGYLYIGTGDGGGGGDPDQNGQKTNSLLGKLLRIDVESGGSPYTIPPNNPYVGTAGYRGEIWALGLRNPWRYSFDRQTGDLYIADVGQDRREEVDFQPASSTGGENYGWNVLEASLCFEPSSGCVQPSHYSAPVAEYDHGKNDSVGCAITGGFVYRGQSYPHLQGIYFYGDFCSGRLWGLKRNGNHWQNTQLLDTPFSISTFGEDEAGNLYLADYGNGDIYLVTDLFANGCTGVTASTSPHSVTYRPTPTKPAKKTISLTITNRSGAPVRVTDIVPQTGDFDILSDGIVPRLPQTISSGRRKTFAVKTQRAADAGTKTVTGHYFNVSLSCGTLTTAREPSSLRFVETSVSMDGASIHIAANGQGIKSIEAFVYDLSGRRLLAAKSEGSALDVRTARTEGLPLANGIYIVEVVARGGEGKRVHKEMKKFLVLR